MKFSTLSALLLAVSVSVSAFPHIDEFGNEIPETTTLAEPTTTAAAEPTETAAYTGEGVAPGCDYDAETYNGRTARECPNGNVMVVVKVGDNLWDLAKEHDKDFEALKGANLHLSNNFDLIYPDDEVCYPTECDKFTGPEVSPYANTEDKTDADKHIEDEKDHDEEEDDDDHEDGDEEDDDQGEAAALTSGAGALTISLFAMLAVFLF
jgi:hypothetical protein